MNRVKVCLGNEARGCVGGGLGVELDAAEGIDQQAVSVIHSFGVVRPIALVGAPQQDSAGPAERLAKMLHVAEGGPDGGGGKLLAAVVRSRELEEVGQHGLLLSIAPSISAGRSPRWSRVIAAASASQTSS